jgi:hypothetical protein
VDLIRGLESAEENGDANAAHSALERASTALALRSGISSAQHQLTLLRSLARVLGTPTRQNFTQVSDSNIYGCLQVDLTISAIVDTIVAEHKYFGAHSSLRESFASMMELSS